MHKNQIVSFVDEVEHNHVQLAGGRDPTYAVADQPDTSLERFMERPIRIGSQSWVPGTPFTLSFNPWDLFFTNPRILNRIANYNLLRCKLNVKFMINGNGFYYGRALASYIPLPGSDNITSYATTGPYNIQRTQRPHVYLDPTTSQGGVMTLPFVWPYNALQIPLKEWDQMGTIILNDMTTLEHATGSTDPLTITIFAWASDFSIEVPTTYTGTLTPQMGMKDEYDGPISKPASLISRVAGMLVPAPVIGSFARATEMAASTVADIACLFGMSRPVLLEAPKPYQPKVFGNIVNTTGSDTCQKLTLDPKQELTIDPVTMGLGSVDEMSIRNIAERESWLTSFTWSAADAPESLLYNFRVTPMQGQEVSGEHLLTPVAFAALPFRYWRGALRFRFQIVASAFHKGRLKVTYDPQYAASNEYNVVYTQVVDIAETRDFSIDVGWGSNSSYKYVTSLADGIENHRATAYTGANSNTNGTLSVYNVTDLSTPDGTAGQSISVNVFISAGPGFEVIDPESDHLTDVTLFRTPVAAFAPQMGEKDPNTVAAEQDNHPEHDHGDFAMASIGSQDKTLQVFFGDPVVSFRQVLKRYNLSRVWPLRLVNGSSSILTLNAIPNFPTQPGYAGVAGSIDRIDAVTPVDFNYSWMTLLNYVSAAYVVRRGGIRWKYHIIDSENLVKHASISRHTGTNNVVFFTTTTLLPHGSGTHQQQFASFRKYPSLLDGAVVTDPRVNPVLEAELPFHSIARFEPARSTSLVLTPENRKNLHQLTITSGVASATSYAQAPAYVSIGEDFTLGFFLSTPSLFITSTLPAGAPSGDF